MSGWIVGYIVGVYYARSASWALVLVFLAAALLFSYRKDWLQVVTVFIGFCWGWSSSGAYIDRWPPPHSCVSSFALTNGYGGVQCGLDFLEVQGPFRITDVKLSCMKEGDLFFPRVCWGRSPSNPQVGGSGQNKYGASNPWISSILFGEKSSLDQRFKHDLRATGLYHLFVISGLHIVLVYGFLVLLLRVPFLIFYSLRMLGPAYWIVATQISSVLALAAVGHYAALVGFTPPTQRAFLLCSLSTLAAFCFGRPPSIGVLRMGLSLQILFFPVGLITPASAMSWIAYLLVSHVMHAKTACDIVRKLARTMRLQGDLALASLCLFGQASLIGLVANLIIVPAFPLYLSFAWLTWILPEYMNGYFQVATDLFREWLSWLASWNQFLSNLLGFDRFVEENKNFVRLAALAYIIPRMLSILAKMSIPRRLEV